jgi:hypothetical protein
LERGPAGRVGADAAAVRAVATLVREEEETVLTVGSGQGGLCWKSGTTRNYRRGGENVATSTEKTSRSRPSRRTSKAEDQPAHRWPAYSRSRDRVRG